MSKIKKIKLISWSSPTIKLDMRKDVAERIFKVNLNDRYFDCKLDDDGNIEIVFGDKGNIFGWLERIPVNEFVKRLRKERKIITKI